MDLEYTISNSSGVQLITIKGRLIEKSQADGLIEDFEQLISGGANKYLMSLEGLEYVNSTGLNLLIGMFTQARNAGGELVMMRTHVYSYIHGMNCEHLHFTLTGMHTKILTIQKRTL